MKTAGEAADPLRYRLYFWLMNLCLAASVLILGSTVPALAPSQNADGSTPSWYLAYGSMLIFFVFFVTPLLVFARFMRDEYAEELFRRSTIVVVYVAIAVPFLIFAAATLVYLVTLAPEAPWPFSLFMGETTWWSALAQPYKAFCILFVFIFQFLRWRDSR